MAMAVCGRWHHLLAHRTERLFSSAGCAGNIKPLVLEQTGMYIVLGYEE